MHTELWHFYMYHDGKRRYRRLMLAADTGVSAKLRALGYDNAQGSWTILRARMMARFAKHEVLELIDMVELE